MGEDYSERRFYAECKACGKYNLISSKNNQKCRECGTELPTNNNTITVNTNINTESCKKKKQIKQPDNQQMSLF